MSQNPEAALDCQFFAYERLEALREHDERQGQTTLSINLRVKYEELHESIDEALLEFRERQVGRCGTMIHFSDCSDAF